MRRDEAAAEAREAASEQRMQEADAARRLAILRGEEPPPLPADDPEPLPSTDKEPYGRTVERRNKRKRAGEDDTDFEMRVARERAAAGDEAALRLRGTVPVGKPTGDESLVDAGGHIALFRPEPEAGVAEKKAEEAARAAAKKKREEEDARATRFTDAAGRGGEGLTDGGPWYAKAQRRKSDDGAAVVEFDAPTKDVWGNEDPRRKERSAARLTANDPLAMMKRGAAKVRELGKVRERDAKERERELRQLRREERRREKRKRRERREREDGDLDGDDGFSVEAPKSERERAERRRQRGHHEEERWRHGRDGRVHGDGSRHSRRSEDDRHRDRESRYRHSRP